ncbi:hypothetical protein BDV24DRAFT_168622 [Aspergillus arachidicola]|uniref:Uncharacterized protein n=1 Tax=Aspergillus arachidicola TaxID=656916 RepID=A0A5N6XTN5_9EURO|nr:hypothetical protein BDV24DRAFT_168622 [Aspergillus arachidicola]
MPFYSLAIYRGSDGNHYGDAALNVLTTPDQETADRYYRFLQTYPDVYENTYKFSNFQRLSAQMWTFQSSGQDDLREFTRRMCHHDFTISDERFRSIVGSVVLQQYQSNVWFNIYGAPIIPDVDLVAPVNQEEFFIRRKRHPGQYWFLEGQYVRTSESQRTKFRIELVDKNVKTSGIPLLIGSDEVRIIALDASSSTTIKSGTYGSGLLGTQGDNSTFKFGAFHQGFNLAVNSTGTADFVTYANSDRWIGEEWELVS